MQAELGGVRHVVNVHDVEDEDHVDLVAVGADGLDDFGDFVYIRHFANSHGVMFAENLVVNLTQVFVHAGAVDEVLPAGVVYVPGRHVWLGVREGLHFADVVYDVHAEAAGSAIEPEVHDVVNCGSRGGVLPI